jgi:Mg-chelatase subunit ChlD
MPVDGKGWTDCGSASAVSGNSGMDLVLAVDTTGSMGGVLDDIKTNILTLFKNLGALGAGVRVGLVDYKDLCDVNMLRQMPLTAIDDPGGISALTSFVASMQAGGGCDWPEKMDLALNAAASMIWRGTVPASIVVIADAPAHPEDESTSYSIAGAFVSKIPGGQVSLVDTGSGGHPFMQSLPRYGGGQYVTYDGDILKSLYPAISGCSET